MNDFCKSDCEYLNITEVDQNMLAKEFDMHIGHRCTKHKVPLYHMLAHPNLYRCEECRNMEAIIDD